MEFMPQQDELPSVGGGETIHVTESLASPPVAVEEELVAAIEIGHSSQQATVSPFASGALQPVPPTKAPQPEKPIYFSDGTMYPSQLSNPMASTSSTSAISAAGGSNAAEGDLTVALPDNLLEIYNNLGLIGKLLTGGSLVTIKFIQAFRTFGESFVNVLGITKPKYEYELNMARQMQEADAARVAKLDQLYASWQTPHPAQSSFGMQQSSLQQPPPPPIAPTYQGPYGVPTAAPMEGGSSSSVPYPPPTMQYGSQQQPPPMMMTNSPPAMMSSSPQQYNPAQVLSVQSLPSQPVHQPPPAAPVNLPPFPSPPQLAQAAAAAADYSTTPFAPVPPQ